MGTHPTFSPSTGPASSYSPKTTDETDSSVGGTVVPHVNVQGGNTVAVKVDNSGVTQPVSGTVNPSAFTPVPATAVALTVGPTATTAPVALPATAGATVYRIRNSASSSSAVAWRLQATTPGIAPVVPTAYSSAGTGGAVGDKQIDPGAVEVFGLTAAQQTAAAAGTLYLSAITPAGGSATITVSLGTAGL